MGIIGAYAQTELGHGSDVQRLQTTATFDNQTKEWVFHTPNIQATKFWPGGIGKVSTHTILLARVITNG
jgi:acyl-CoA oxidase